MSKKHTRLIVIAGIIVALISTLLYLPTLFISRDANYIKKEFGKVSMPSSYALKSTNQGSSEFATVMRYHYVSPDSINNAVTNLTSSLNNQGYKTEELPKNIKYSSYSTNASNEKSKLHISAGFYAKSPNTEIDLEVTKCGNSCAL